jgi:hypothetical protein
MRAVSILISREKLPNKAFSERHPKTVKKASFSSKTVVFSLHRLSTAGRFPSFFPPDAGTPANPGGTGRWVPIVKESQI